MAQDSGIFKIEKNLKNNSNKAKLWLLGGASLIGTIFGGKIAAQNPENQADSIFLNNSRPSTELPADSIPVRRHLEFMNFLDAGEAKDVRKIIPLISFGNINLVEIQVNEIKDLAENSSIYNIKNDSITVYHFSLSKDAAARDNFYNQALGQHLSRDEMLREIRIKNYESILSLAHELKHWLDRHSFLRLGFLVEQITELDITEEIVGPIAELLYIRGVFRKTGDIAAAFSGIIYDKSKVFQYDKGFGEYKEYLRGNPMLDAAPSAKEITVIIKCATNMMLSCESQYSADIPKVIEYDCANMVNPLNYYKRTGNKKYNAPLVGFASAVKTSYTFGKDFLNESGAPGKAAVDKCVQRFMKRGEFKNKNKKWQELNVQQSQFREYAARIGRD
ncbi:MAG: hypothetical protein LBJ18_00910 [Rickettsiales bacterium]|jgi:hypothetical protein|nr:hypothetical protein [Rickettsiales bacterium]